MRLLALETTGLPRARPQLSADGPSVVLPTLQPTSLPGDEILWKVWLLVEEKFGSKACKGLPAPLLGLGVGCNKQAKMGGAGLGGIRDSLQ